MAALALAACSGDDAAPTEPTPAKPNASLLLREYSFDPSRLVLRAGEQATIEVRNAGTVTHNLSIPSISADLDIAPGHTETVIFVAPRSGEVEVFCKLHRDLGMTGTFAVS